MQAQSMETRTMSARLAILAAAVLAAGCVLEPSQESQAPGEFAVWTSQRLPGDLAVRGTATGVLGPVALELRQGAASERLVVAQDGSFTFGTRLATGVSYAVALVDPGTPCSLRNQTGVIAAAGPPIELTCTGASLASLVVSGLAPTIALTPGMIDHVVDLPLSQPSVTLTAAVAVAGDTVTIAGKSVASGAPSAKLGLRLGDNPVEIVVENHLGWRRTYRLTLRRAGQLAQYAYAKASNTGEYDSFGAHGVALSGDTLVVGAWAEDSAAQGVGGDQDDEAAEDSGAVYVFRRMGAGWQQEAYLKASNTGAGDAFGFDVALSGDTLVVAAPGESSAARGVGGDQDDEAAADSGAVYVFRRTGADWQQEAYLKASNTDARDFFGASVALSGDTLVVGAPNESGAGPAVGNDQDDDSVQSSGAAYVFRRTGAGWRQEAYVKAPNTGLADWFGWSVVLAGDILAVSAPGEDSAARGVGGNQDDEAAPGSGAVYVFRRTGADWQQEAYVKASNTGTDDEFGWSVALSGDTLAVGAPGEDSVARGVGGDQDDDSVEDSGAVYVFRRTGVDWQQQAYVKASNPGIGDGFGKRVALLDDTLAVGAYYESSAAQGVDGNQNDDGAHGSGAAYVFRRTGADWQQEAYVKASNTGTGDMFGTSLALSADTLAVGAYYESSAAEGVNGDQTDDSLAESGAVYIFH